MKFSNESIEAMARGGEAAAVVSLMDSLFDDIFSPSISIDFPPQFRTDFVSGMFVADADANLGSDSVNSQGAASSRKRGENNNKKEGPPLTRKRQPIEPKEESNWWRRYLKEQWMEDIRNVEREESIPRISTRTAEFRSTFRVPFSVFEKLVELTVNDKQWYDPTVTNAAGEPCKDIRLLILGALNCLSHATTFSPAD